MDVADGFLFVFCGHHLSGKMCIRDSFLYDAIEKTGTVSGVTGSPYLEKLFIAPKVRQVLYGTSQRVFTRCVRAAHRILDSFF